MFEVEAVRGRFANKNPIGIFLARDRVRAWSGVAPACTTFLVQNGYALTNRHCLVDLWGTGQPWAVEGMRLYFRNPNDEQVTAFLVKRIVAERFMVPNKQEIFRRDKSDEENEHLAESFEDWAILEPENREALAMRFGSLSLERKSPAGLGAADQLILEVWRVNPPLRPGEAFTLEALNATLRRRHIDPHTEVFENVLKYAKVLSVEETRIRHGNSGSPLLYQNKVYGMIGLAADKNSWHWPTREIIDVSAGFVQWFPAADAALEIIQTK